MRKVEIRFFKNKESQNRPDPINLFDWLTTDRFRDQVLKIRECSNQKEIDNLKGRLPCAMPSLQMNGSHSGYIAIDVDGANHNENLSYTPEELKLKVSSIANVAYCGYSCSGRGVWALIPLFDTTRHLEHFRALEAAFKTIGLVIDSACSNVNRLRFCSYDSDPYINENAIPFSLIWVDAPQQKVKLTSPDFVKSATIFDEFNQKADVIGLLANHGWKKTREKGDRIKLTRPDKLHGTSGEFSTSKRLFFCYTASAQFEANKAYNAVQLLSILECNEDIKRTAKAIKHLNY